MRREEAKAVIAAIVAMRESATDEQALSAAALYPEWRPNMECKSGMRLLHGGTLYKVNEGMGHTSQAGWEPDAAPSLFAKVLIPDPDVIPEWERPDSTNGYSKGDRVMYEGRVVISNQDDNVHEPTEQNVALGIWLYEEGE